LVDLRCLRLTACLLIGILGLSCAGSTPEDSTDGDPDMLVPGVAKPLAVQRTRTISNLHYEISLSIPASRAAAITGAIVATFDLSETDSPLVFDFAQPANHVNAVKSAGKPVDFVAENEHVVISAGDLQMGRNEIEIDFIAGDGSLNRNEEYLYTLFVPDRARVAIPVFDQPNLKARCILRLEVPSSWKAVANGELTAHEAHGERHTYSFHLSDPIPTYLLAFAAGRFEIETAERDGLSYRMLHRETDNEKLERNLEAIFDLHHASRIWLEKYTEISYPFQKFDFVAIPAFQYGGMEHPGAIFYRARTLFLDESATQSDLLGRASLIAHETAHMWFGNLVTMEWFDDVWMKEVMANFMAAKIVNPSFPGVDHDLRFLLAHYPRAYQVDRTDGANPIRQDLANLNEAGSLYGAIIYQKAPIVMRHLELLLGEGPFQDGIRQYLDEHRYANATWPDLITVMDALTEQDLAAWSDTWVHEAGRPLIRTQIETAGGAITSFMIEQSDPQDRGRLWTQPLQVLLGYRSARDRGIADRLISVDLHRPLSEVSEAVGLSVPDFVLANGAGVGYGNFVLDQHSREDLLKHLPATASSHVRAIAWLSLWDSMLAGEVTPQHLLGLAVRALESESDELNIQRFLDDLLEIFWRFLPTAERKAQAPGLETLLWRQLEAAPQARLKSAYFAAYRELALSDTALARLTRMGSKEETVPGLPLGENEMTQIVQGLAVRDAADADIEALLDTHLERITNPDRRAQFEFVRPALSADTAVRDRFFEGLRDADRREHERWVLEALGFLHHPLRAESSEHLILRGLEMLEEIQRTGDIFFPLGWLQATLDGHSSTSAAEIVRIFLAENPDLPPRLRGKLLQAADPLFRAAEILQTD